MADKPVIIEYHVDVPATVYTPAHVRGERFTITSAAKAMLAHPEATIVGYENGTPFDSRNDESMVELRAAMKGEREAAKAASDAAAAQEAEREKLEAAARKQAEADAAAAQAEEAERAA